MNAGQTAAVTRLRKWSDMRASGSPTARMTQIWPTPFAMCQDIRTVLSMLDEKVTP